MKMLSLAGFFNRKLHSDVPRITRVVSLDAMNTLIAPQEPPPKTYCEFAEKRGILCDQNKMEAVLSKSIHDCSLQSPCFGHKFGGAHKWWAEVVTNSLKKSAIAKCDEKVAQQIATELFEYFADGKAWKIVDPEVGNMLTHLRHRGFSIAVLSNFDFRLRSILSQLKLAQHFDIIVPTKRKEQTIRTRDHEDVDGDESAAIVKDFGKRKRRDNPMIQSTKKTEEKQDNASSSSSDEEVVNEHAYPASGTDVPLGPMDRGATFTTEKDTSYDADAQSQFERVQQILKEGGVEKDGKTLYKGMAMYGAKIAPDTVKGNAANGLNRIGPMRASQFMRSTVRWDYAPDICKDYKETGFCTFGDSCKFLHDRSDYKHGWEIERDYLAGNLNEVDDTNYEIPEEDQDAFPEDCFICGNKFENPIVTSCKHYFCEACAIKAYKKSKRCRICNENTGGIFNVAKDLIQKLKEKQVKAEEPQEQSEGEEEVEEKPDISQEHEHHEGCSHSHEVKEEPIDEAEITREEELDNEEMDEEDLVDTEPQQEVEICMEDVEDDGNVSNSSDIEDEEEKEQ